MIKLKVKDIEWSFEVLEDKDYEAKHGKESHGITDKFKLLVDFKRSSFSEALVRHELFHTYVASCCINSIDDLDGHSMEEISAELVEFHLADIHKNSKKIYNSLTIQLKKVKNEQS